MDKTEIRKEVVNQIDKWRSLARLNNRNVEVSDNVINFISDLIENLKTDPPQGWKSRRIDYSNGQSYALSLIPNALNDVDRRLRFRSHSVISVWEIYESLSVILKNWCFIPEDI
ncbi:hypothetical protein [Mesoflavibacter zeaxanthinifaciens]|uniref:hypothetical protein n=1 Tax=Mesoflavibacter zeaxanthinifaciens TaxID=393060 RepID=UPI003A952ACE